MDIRPYAIAISDAVRAFLQGNLDYLAMGSFLVEHPSHRS